MSLSSIKKCDICGGRMGFELKSSDFVTEPLIMGMKDIDNNDVTISCVLNIKHDSPDNMADDIIDDVINDYDPLSYIPEALYGEPYNVNTMLMDKHLEKTMAKSNDHIIPNGDLCKKCHKVVLRLVNDYAKHDELIKF